jgi:hypothetical protein
MGHFEGWVDRVEGLGFSEIAFFKFRRAASLDHLMNQARNKHYSTFSLYRDVEFAEALTLFREELRRNVRDLQCIEWIGENIMLTLRKDSSN